MKKPRAYFFWALSAVMALIAAGCGQTAIKRASPIINQDAALRAPPSELYPTPALRTEGSLFNDEVQLDFFSDLKARQVGDIVTINIVENSNGQKNAQTSLGRNGSWNASLGLFGVENKLRPPGLDLTQGIDTSYANRFSGSGATSRKETMTAQMSARVVQVLPNGHLIIRGSREVLLNNEKQYMILQGVIRPQDIDANNTIQSTYVADARIDYTGQGDLSGKQREGWLTRALSAIWPF